MKTSKKDDVVEMLKSGKIEIYVSDNYQRWLDSGEGELEDKCPECGGETVIEYQRVDGKELLVEECQTCDYESILKMSLAKMKVAKEAS
jgi:DNA-directed RNA polymerase subunit M/transcription elongation factor TFIIS